MTDERHSGEEPTLPSDSDATVASDAGIGRPGPDSALASPALPDEIGGYRITGKLGEGGMGIVFSAEQSNPRRNVALKVIRAGSLADEVQIRLFQREADTLGRLRHPGIAQIYESGVTDDGHHYFAMELALGDTLDVWLQREGKSVSLREKLALFRDIADAVHHAHQRGVIHRDLKSANVIITPPVEGGTRDGRPGVKVLDFGLARLLDRSGEGTMLSTPGAIRGTLAYMSPEQARGAVDEIDVRSDVYALGVVLYRMITERAPYDTDRASVLTSVRAICEDDPAPMGVKDGRVDADLELITLKAIAKEASGRYASADALSDDVGRWLADEPIEARPPSTMYQVRKLVKRHKLPVAAAAGALAMVVLFGVGMAFLYAQSERNLDRALIAEASAQEEAVRAQQATRFLVDIFQVSDPDKARGKEVTAREILDQGAERIHDELAASPDLQADLLATIAVVYRQLGMDGRSAELLRQGLEIRRAHDGPRDYETARVLIDLGQTVDTLGDYEDAEAQLREAIAILEETEQGRQSWHYPQALAALASVRAERGERAEATALYERALPEMRRVKGEGTLEVALVLNNMATHLTDTDPARARALLEESLAIRRELLPPDHSLIADTYTNLGVVADTEGDPVAATEYHRHALEILEEILDPDHPELAGAIGNVAIALAGQGRFEEALPLFVRVAGIFEKAYGPDHPNYARSLHNIGYFQYETGDLQAAEATLGQALAIREQIHGRTHPDVALTLYFVALIEHANGDLPAARRDLERVVAIDRESWGSESQDVAEDLGALAGILREMGDVEAAEAAEAEAARITAQLEQGG